MDMIKILFAFIFAIACALLAERKERNGAIWFILGLVFNVFAFLVLVFLKKKVALKRCFYCGADADYDDKICKVCKKDLDI